MSADLLSETHDWVATDLDGTLFSRHWVGVGAVPWYYFIGGLLGAGYITTVIFTVGVLGAGGITAATVSAQLVTSMILDQFGWFGLEKHPITWTRLAGVLLLAAGTYLVVAGRD